MGVTNSDGGLGMPLADVASNLTPLPQQKTPVVLVHGLFGWGESRPLFGAAPSYFPLRQLRSMWTSGPVIAVDVGVASSDHDRACEVFAQLLGRATDYGEDHARSCGHSRYGPDYRAAGQLVRRWDAAHPIHLVGHSFGGNTIVALLALLAEDFWGLGTSPDWVLSVTCICAPLRGCSLAFALAFEQGEQGGDKLALRLWSPIHILSIFAALLVRAQVKFPGLGLKGLYDLRCDQWGAHKLTWKRLIGGDHPYWQSGDNVAVMSTPGHTRRMAQAWLKPLSKTRLIAVCADPVEPLSPAGALCSASPYLLASAGALFACGKLRRLLAPALAYVARRRSVLSTPLVAIAFALLLRLVRKQNLQRLASAHGRAQAFEEAVPQIHAWMIRPAMRILSHSIHQATSAMGSSDQLATRCSQKKGNDGLIDLAAQRWLDAPFAHSTRGKPRGPMQRCTSAVGQDRATGGKSLGSSFSQTDVRHETEAHAPLEMGKWRVLGIAGADHALGTTFSDKSVEMYRSVFALLETVSRHR